MEKYELISRIATEMAKDDSINIDLISHSVFLADKNEELLSLMKKWYKSRESSTITAIDNLLVDYKLFGEDMYGK